MAVNLNPPPANQSVSTVLNPPAKVKDLGVEKRPVELPSQAVPQVTKPPQIKADAATILTLDKDRQDQAKGNFDNPDRKTKQALNAYRDIAKADKRAEIQSLVGVDIYV